MKYYKTYILSSFLATVAFFFIFLFYYFHKTNIITTIDIKINTDDVYIINQINVKAFGPLNRSFDIKYCKKSKSWDTQELYLNRLEITIPDHIAKDDSFSITINNKLIETYKSGINSSIFGDNKRITIDQISPKNFSEKFVYFMAFYFNRLIGLKILFKKYLTLIIYLSMLIFVFIKVKAIQKKSIDS